MGDKRRTLVLHDSSSDEEGLQDVSEEAYKSLLTAQALRGENYCAATQELEQLLDNSTWCSKGALALLARDVALAIQCCQGDARERLALASLMEAVERRLPQAKRKELLREYRRSSMVLRRRERKGSRNSMAFGKDSESDGEGGESATFCYLPREVVSSVLAYLSPLDLARASCVCSEWRQLASEGRLWEPLLVGTFSAAQRAQLLRQARRVLGEGACESAADTEAEAAAGAAEGAAVAPRGALLGGASSLQAPQLDSAFHLAFTLGARRHPRAVMIWKTNRVLRGGRLAWLSLPERQALLGSCLAAGGRTAASAGRATPTGAPPRAGGGPGGGGMMERGAALAGGGVGASRWQHLSAREVVDYLRRGGRLPPSPANSSGSSSSDSEGEAAVLSTRLKFWRAE